MRSRAAVALALSVALVAACAPALTVRPSASTAGMVVEELTMHPAMGVYPAAYRAMVGDVRAAYDYAISHRDVLQWMPCYCGCASPSHGRNGHKNNYDCYVAESRADGSVTLELHATTCYTCVGITNDVASMIRAGTTDLPTIRRAVDKKWSKYGPGTPTKFPPAS